MTNQKSLKKPRIQQIVMGLDRSGSLIPVFPVFPASPTEVLIHSSLSQVPIRGEAGQCSVTSMCNKVTTTQHLSRKNQPCSWHERSSSKGAGNGIFKDNNMVEESYYWNHPHIDLSLTASILEQCLFSSNSFKNSDMHIFGFVENLYFYQAHHEYCQKLITFRFFPRFWKSIHLFINPLS